MGVDSVAGTGQVDLYRATGGLGADELTAIDPAVAANLPPDSLLAGLGIEPTHIGRGACRARMRVGRGHLNQRGVAQAGAVVALADAAAGWAAYAAVADGGFTTLELRCSMLRAVRDGDLLVATAGPVHLGRRTLVLDVEVRRAAEGDQPERAVARFGCTQLVLGAGQ